MQRHLAALTIVLLLSMVLTRVAMLRRQGVRAMNFGKQDRTDFLIPPFALFYFYLVFAHAFGWPTVARGQLFDSGAVAWLGVAFCVAGLLFLLLVFLAAATWLFHRQVRREEAYLAQRYGAEYADYCRRVRRYL